MTRQHYENINLGIFLRYSTIWLARALQADGKVVTLELNEKHAKVSALSYYIRGLRLILY